MRLNSISPPRELSRAVSSSESARRLQLLADTFPDTPLAGFTCWEAARLWLDHAGARAAAADVVLGPILTAFKLQPDEVWHNILLLLFWRSLSRLDSVARRWDQNPDDAGSETASAFIQVLNRIDLAQRAEAFGQKIINDTWHDVRLHYSRARAYDERFKLPVRNEEDDKDTQYEAGADPGEPDPAFAMVDHRHDVAYVRARLRELVRQGILSRVDYLILIGCYLYGRRMDSMATRLGMTYQATKKRRQRALGQWKKYAMEDVPSGPRETP